MTHEQQYTIRYAHEHKGKHIVFSIYNRFGREVGYATYDLTTKVLDLLFIEPQYRNRGIGKTLLLQSITTIKRLYPEIKTIQLTADQIIDNIDIHILEKFYISCGFVVINRDMNTRTIKFSKNI